MFRPSSTLLMTIFMIVVLRTVDMTKIETLHRIYLVYVTVHGLLALALIDLYFRILRRADHTKLCYKEPKSLGSGLQPQEGDGNTETTHMNYDLAKWRELAFSRLFLGVLILCFVHYKWGVVPPLLYQCVHHPMTLYNSPIFQIHTLGKRAYDNLQRPFAEPNALLRMTQGAEENAKPSRAERRREKSESTE